MTPTSGNWSTVGGSGTGTLNASFTHLPEPSSVGQAVALTDTSTGSPATWNWTIDGVLTNSTQNAAYIFSTAGSYPIFLNVTNATGAWSNTSATHTVVNASGYTPQDVWMEGQYTVAFTITDSTTGAAIPVVVVTTSDGQSYTTTNGTAYFTEGFGTYVAYFSATDYVSKSVSFIVDGDDTVAVQMTPTTPQNPYNVKYPPKDVRFHAQTGMGQPLPLTWVEAVPYHTPLGSYEYVASLFGYDLSTVPLESLTMNGSTDSHGDITFAMMTDVQYYITATKTGYTFTPLNITPHDDNYLIVATYNGSLMVTNGTSPAAEVRFNTTYTRINQTAGFVNLSVVDTAGVVTNGVFNITQRNSTANSTSRLQVASATFDGNTSWANFTFIDATTASCPHSTATVYNASGTGVTCLNQTVVDDSSYQTTCTAYTASGTVYETGVVWFRRMASPIAGLSPEFALFIALAIMMFTALMAGTSTAPAISLVFTFEGWVFWGLNMFALLDGPLVTDPMSGTTGAMTMVPAILTFMTFICIIWLFVEYRRKGK